MLIQILPSLIMFTITLIFVTLFFVPATFVKHENELIRFYWIGFWSFLGMIAAFAGAAETLALINYDARSFSNALLASLVVCFSLFVGFGWFRLSFKAITAGVRQLRSKFS